MGSSMRPRFLTAESKEKRELEVQGVLWGCCVCVRGGGKPYRSLELEKHRSAWIKNNERQWGHKGTKKEGNLQRGLKIRKEVGFRSLERVQTGSQCWILRRGLKYITARKGCQAILGMFHTVQHAKFGVTRTPSVLQRLSSLCRLSHLALKMVLINQ